MDFNKRYFFVNSEDFFKVLWLLKSSAGFSPQYYPNGELSAKVIFNAYGIPSNYQKIVMKKDLSMIFKKYNFCELISEFPFYCVKHDYNLSGGYVYANCMPFYSPDSQLFYNFVSFKTFINYFSYDVIIKYFTNMANDGFIDGYFESLKQLFDLNEMAINKISERSFDFQKTLKK